MVSADTGGVVSLYVYVAKYVVVWSVRVLVQAHSPDIRHTCIFALFYSQSAPKYVFVNMYTNGLCLSIDRAHFCTLVARFVYMCQTVLDILYKVPISRVPTTQGQCAPN